MSGLALEKNDLFSIVTGVCSDFLGLETLELSPEAQAELGPTDVTSFVHVDGDWVGTVTISMPSHLANRLAEAMFAAEASELSADEIIDAVGEVTNMIGGGVKNKICAGGKLSTPGVLQGPGAKIVFPGAWLKSQAAARVDHSGLSVSVFELV